MTTSTDPGGWRLPNLIDLGDLRAKFSVSLPLVIKTPVPTQLTGELNGLTVIPDQLPAGENLIRVTMPGDRLNKDTMLVGQLTMRAGRETRTVWVIGRVIDEELKQWAKETIQLVAPSKRRYCCRSGMALGKQMLAGEAINHPVTDHPVYLRREESGVWAIFQPYPDGSLCTVNGQPLLVGTRMVLLGGETIQIDALKLQVETNTTGLALEVESHVDFGRLSARHSPLLHIKNRSRQSWSGILKANVPWIVVPQPNITCAPQQTIQVPLQLGAGVPGTIGQLLDPTGALLLEGQNEIWSIRALVQIDARDELELTPHTINWGRVGDHHQVPTQQLRLKNLGSQTWQGRVTAAVPWLSVNVDSVHLPAGEETTLEVRLNEQVQRLMDGPHTVAEGLQIEGQQQRVVARVQLRYQQPQAQIAIEPKLLDWGHVSNWQAAPIQTLDLINSGDRAWQGQVETKVLWLNVSPNVVQCSPGGRTTVTVQLNHHAQNLPTFVQKVPAAVRVTGGDITVAALVRVQMQPSLQLTPERLNLVVTDRRQLPTYPLQLTNPTAQPWTGVATTPFRWLKIMPDSFSCPSGGSVTLHVTLDPSANTIFKKAIVIEELPDVVQIQGEGVKLALSARLELNGDAPQNVASPQPANQDTPSQPVSLSASHPLNFGVVVASSAQLPVRHLRLTNSNQQIMQGNARANGYFWLDVTPATFSCPPGQEVLLTIRLNDDVRTLRPKHYRIADALLIENNGQQTLVGIELEIQRAANDRLSATPTQALLAAALNVDFGIFDRSSTALPTRELRLDNPSEQTISGRARVNDYFWLEVSPTTFSCPPGQGVTLSVRLNESARQLRPKHYAIADAITLESNRQEQTIGVKMEIARDPPTPPVPPAASAPMLKLTPAVLDFGVINRGVVALPAQTLVIQNNSAAQWNGTVTSTLPWLEVEPLTVSCPAGESFQATARLNQQALYLYPKLYIINDAIVLEGGVLEGGGQKIEVQLSIKVSRV